MKKEDKLLLRYYCKLSKNIGTGALDKIFGMAVLNQIDILLTNFTPPYCKWVNLTPVSN